MERKKHFSFAIMLFIIVFGVLVLLAPYFYSQLLTLNKIPDIETSFFIDPTIIESVSWDENTHQIKIIVEHVGKGTVTLEQVYVNKTFDSNAVISKRVLSQNETAEIVLSQKYDSQPNQIEIRVTTIDELELWKNKIFYEIGIIQVDWDKNTGKIQIVVRNSGDETVTLSKVSVNGAVDVPALPNLITLDSYQKIPITLTATFMNTHTPISIKVMSQEGIFAESSKSIYNLWIQSINWNSKTGNITAYVYENGYEGAGNEEIAYVYVNGTLDPSPTINDGNGFWNLTLSKNYSTKPQQLTLKIVTSNGTSTELTMTPPNEY